MQQHKSVSPPVNASRCSAVRGISIPGCLLAALLVAPVAWSGAISIALHGPGTSFNVDVPSNAEARWESVIRQQYDFSCGSAAVATLMTYHYDTPTSEEAVFQAMIRAGDRNKIQTEGFSMLDMKRYLDDRGMSSDGFRMTLDSFASLGVPGIALVNTRGYRHFVVVRGVDDKRVLLGDPAAGNTAISREDFEQIWGGAVLAAREKRDIARQYFNTERDWRSWPSARLDQSGDQLGLGMFLLTLPGPGQF